MGQSFIFYNYRNTAFIEPSIQTGLYPTGYDAWITETVASAKYHGNLWDIGVYNSGNAYGPTAGKGLYEPWYSFRRLSDHLGGDAELDNYAIIASQAWIDANYNLAGGPANANTILHYPDGMGLEYLRESNTGASGVIITQSQAGYARDSSTIAWVKDQSLSREVTYSLLDYLNVEVSCGRPHRARMEYYQNILLGDINDSFTGIVSYGVGTEAVALESGGHIEQWLGTYTTDDDGNYVSGTTNFVSTDYGPFMGGLQGYALAKIYDNAPNINTGGPPDARTIAKLTRLADATWNESWEAVSGAKSFYLRPSQSQDAPALNNLVVCHWWWLYLKTGKQRFLDRADEAFNATVGYESLVYRNTGNNPPQYITKEFAELTRQTIDGLGWRASGVQLYG